MQEKYRTTFVKIPKKTMSTVLEKCVFNTINEAQDWANKLKIFVEYEEDLELLNYALDKSTRIEGTGFVPLRMSETLGCDGVVSIKPLNNQIEIVLGLMTPRMAKVFNRN